MSFAKSYNFTRGETFDNLAWIVDQQVWITPYGTLSDHGFKDHYGGTALNFARATIPKYDHLRFSVDIANAVIKDALGRSGLNIARHPLGFQAFIGSMWRFSSGFIENTLPEYGDHQQFFAWQESLAEVVSKRDGQDYEQPENLIAGAVRTDH